VNIKCTNCGEWTVDAGHLKDGGVGPDTVFACKPSPERKEIEALRAKVAELENDVRQEYRKAEAMQKDRDVWMKKEGDCRIRFSEVENREKELLDAAITTYQWVEVELRAGNGGEIPEEAPVWWVKIRRALLMYGKVPESLKKGTVSPGGLKVWLESKPEVEEPNPIGNCPDCFANVYTKDGCGCHPENAMTNLDRLISQYEDECARENWGDEILVEVKALIKNLTDVERAHGEIVEEYKAIDKKLAEVEKRADRAEELSDAAIEYFDTTSRTLEEAMTVQTRLETAIDKHKKGKK